LIRGAAQLAQLVRVEHEVVGHDGVAGGEERNQPADQVPFGR